MWNSGDAQPLKGNGGAKYAYRYTAPEIQTFRPALIRHWRKCFGDFLQFMAASSIITSLSLPFAASLAQASPVTLTPAQYKPLPKSVCAHLDNVVIQMFEKEAKGEIKVFEINTQDIGNYMDDKDINCFGILYTSKGKIAIDYGIEHTPKGQRIIYYKVDFDRTARIAEYGF